MSSTHLSVTLGQNENSHTELPIQVLHANHRTNVYHGSTLAVPTHCAAAIYMMITLSSFHIH